MPKKKIADTAGGEEWEVVAKRETVVVEDDSSDGDLSSEDETQTIKPKKRNQQKNE